MYPPPPCPPPCPPEPCGPIGPCLPINLPSVVQADSTITFTESVNSYTGLYTVNILPQTAQRFPIKFFALKLASITINATEYYLMNVNVSQLNIQHSILSVQLTPLSNTPQTFDTAFAIFNFYLDTSNNILQLDIFGFPYNYAPNYTGPAVLYITYY